MKLRDLFTRKAQANSGYSVKSGLRRVWSQAPKSETTRLPNLFHQTPRLDAVDLIASTIANSNIQLFDKVQLRKSAEPKPLLDHPFLDLMDSPSKMFPEIDGNAIKYLTIVLTELLGECFWIKLRAGVRVDELLIIPPSWCIQTPTSGNPIFMFQPIGTTAGNVLTVAPEDVVWFKQPDVADPYGRGRGRTEAVGGELDADEMAEKWQKNYFYNDATPPFWANSPGAKIEDLERMRDTWGQRLGGWLNVRKPAFTNSESMTITKLGDTVKEMDFVESRRFLRDVFLNHYAIPPEMFGIIENSNRSTIDAAYYLFAKNVISRRLGFYERVITRQLIAPDFDARLVVRFDFEVPEDEEFRLKKVNEGLARGALTRADWKLAMGYPVEAGDDVYLMPSSVTVMKKGELPPEPEPATPEPDEPIIEIDDEKPEPEDDDKSFGNSRQLHWKMADDRAKQGEGMFRARTRAYSDVQRGRMLKALGKYNPYDYIQAIDETFKGSDEALMHGLAPAWMASMTDGAEIARGLIGKKIAPSFTLYNEEFDKWIKKFGLLKVVEINSTTYSQLREKMQAELADGIEAGESIENLAARLVAASDGVYDNMSQARAEMIARTETMGSVNYGQLVVYQAEGVDTKEWLATRDGDTRDSHIMMDGMQVPIHESFNVPGFGKVAPDTMMYPTGGSVAGQNINCRCTIVPVLD